MLRSLAFFLICLPAFLNAQDFRAHVQYLASDSMMGRPPATVYEKRAADYLQTFLEKNDIPVGIQMFPYADGSARNVLGFLNLGKDSTILISAHYDHLGMGGSKSREILRKGIHNGADDNASGVALMLELAKTLKKSKSHYNYLFAGFSGHEEGLLGSSDFSGSMFCDTLKLRAVLNFDMVGRMDPSARILRISGAQTENAIHQFLINRHSNPLYLRFDDENLETGDLKNFKGKAPLLLNFTTGVHEDYHRITDDEEKINYEGMMHIYHLVVALIEKLQPELSKKTSE